MLECMDETNKYYRKFVFAVKMASCKYLFKVLQYDILIILLR